MSARIVHFAPGAPPCRRRIRGIQHPGRAAPVPQDPPTVETLRVHRVMTDDLEIIAPNGGDFDYRIVLPG